MTASESSRKFRIENSTPSGEEAAATLARALIHPKTNEPVAKVGPDGILGGTAINSLIPMGAVLPYAGATAPTGWALCYGQELAVATYPALDALLGTTYGDRTDGAGGAGASHFRVPDLRGRVVAGQDDMGGTSANRLTAAVSFDGDVLGGVGGDQGNPAVVAVTSTGDAFGFEEGGGLASKVQPTIILNYIIKLA